MADFSQINAEINAKIVPYNNAQDITGKKLNDTLHDMVSAVDLKKQDTLSDEQLENINDVPNKVDKIEGKGLSSNDYTDGEKSKLGALPTKSALDAELADKQDVITDLAIIREGAALGETALQEVPDEYVTDTELTAGLATKQNTISDLADIREGAGKGATAYQKPSAGIPKTDLAEGVKESLDKADSALQSVPSEYVTDSELNTALNGKVDKVAGKGLSSNDYTDDEKAKLGALPTASELDTELNKKADKDGVIAFAKDIVSREDGIGAQFIRRRSAGQLHIGNGSAFMRSIHGKSIVWNQLIGFNDGTSSGQGLTCVRQNGKMSFSGISTQSGIWSISNKDLHFKSGHKYLLRGTTSGSDATYRIWINSSSAFPELHRLYCTSSAMIGTAMADEILAAERAFVQIMAADVDMNGVEITPQLIDLTQMFGAGNEPSTAAEFEALYSKSYYPHNEGQIVNLKATKLLTNGFNQWDEQWEKGAIDTTNGSPIDSTNQIRSKNFCSCMPSTSYYLHCGDKVGLYWAQMFYYDAEHNFVGRAYVSGSTFTTPGNAQYFKIATNSYDVVYGSTYNHDICINFSNASLNGTYKPYEEHELTLPAGLTKTYTGADGQTHTWQGLDSAGSAYDEQTPTKDIQRIGVVDLGASVWVKTSYGFSTQIIGMKEEIAQGMIIGYTKVAFTSLITQINNSFAFASNFIGISGGNETDPAAFKARMAGVLFFYELAEPIVTEFPARNFNYFVNDMGQEWILPEGVDEQGVPLTAPFNAVIAYASNVRDTIFHLPENYLSHESTIALLEAMKSANIIASYTMTFDAATNKYNFTITKA